jgi:hypothetical protein
VTERTLPTGYRICAACGQGAVAPGRPCPSCGVATPPAAVDGPAAAPKGGQKATARLEKELQRQCEAWARLHGYRLLQAEYIASESVRPGWRGEVRGWYGHWFESQRNAFMPDLFVCDRAMRRCLMVELKVRSKYQPGQRELIDAGLWIEVRTLERFAEVLAKWEADQGDTNA